MYREKPKGWLKHLDFVIWDLICLEIAFYLAFMFRHNFQLPEDLAYREINMLMLLFDFLSLNVGSNFKNVLKRGIYAEFVQVLKNAVFVIALPIVYLFAVKDSETYSRIVIFATGVLYVVICYIWRLIWKQIIGKSKKMQGNTRLLVVTRPCDAADCIHKIREENYNRYNICGLVIVGDIEETEIEGVPIVCKEAELGYYITINWVDEVLLSLTPDDPKLKGMMALLHETGVTSHIVINSYIPKYKIESFCGYTVLTDSMNYITITQQFIKRMMDIIGAVIGLVFTGILFLFVAPLIYISSPGPIFYSQERIGKNGKKFKMYKFRSMVVNADELKKKLMAQNKLSDGKMFKMDFDPRVIGNKILPDGREKRGIGNFIRKTSIDEFPQFWNVLKGDMSLVGTRPPLESEVAEYEAKHKCRLSIKPGLSGLWQVSGRSKITDFDKVVELDKEYINSWSIGLDIKVIVKTICMMVSNESAM